MSPATAATLAAPLPLLPSRCNEIGHAIDVLNSLAAAMTAIHRNARTARPVDVRHATTAIYALIDDFIDDPDAVNWALAANRRMYHLCRRAVGCAVHALAMGRRLEFERTALHDLMLGALLLDIGKLRVPVVILAKASRLSQTEHKFARRHVRDGVRLLEDVDGLAPDSLEMVSSHHERIDGSGYPCRLKGDEISLYAQIAGIVDSYDALSLSRYYADGLSGNAALRELLCQSGTAFDAQLLEHFREAIGEFPTGTWVELDDGCIGVVCAQNNATDGGANVALIADEQQQPFLEVRWLSLHAKSGARLLPPAERPAHAGAMERSLQSAVYAFRPRRY